MGAALSSRKSARCICDDDGVYKHELLSSIIQWNPGWLNDPKYDKKPPPILKKGETMMATSLFYKNFEEYAKTLEPLMLVEFFHVLRKDSEDSLSGRKENNCILAGKSYHYRYSGSLTNGKPRTMNFNFITRIKRSFKEKCPNLGDLVKFKYDKEQQVFGYIEKVTQETDKSFPKNSSNVLCCRDIKCPGCMLLVYRVRAKAVIVNPTIKENMQLTSILSVSQYVRILRGLRNLPESPLFNSILKPETSCYAISKEKVETILPLVSGKNLNKTQMEVIAGICKTVAERKKRICLIQGPPGTGKSTVIVNTILEILKKTDQKILVCAPSNKAVDEIVLRLLHIDRDLEDEDRKLNIVRVGREEFIDPGVTEVTLSYLYFGKKMVNLKLSGSKTPDQHREEEKILANANVIASTLTSCFSHKMETVFGKSGIASLSVCIVDEAAQATEVVTLIPLMLGVKKLILVGDPQQLPPTVFSQEAKKFGMGISLFTRAQRIFAKSRRNPIKMLNVQYRMIEPIARWPNKCFYRGKLTSAAIVPELPVHNYKILNHSSSQTSSKHGNYGEAKMVFNLLVGVIDHFLKRKQPVPSIGVITPYREQRELIINNLEEFLKAKFSKTRCKTSCKKKGRSQIGSNDLSNILQDIRINTVDSFQGQERDIIILSCVRSAGIGFVSDPNRLNVSLTRAKHSLILCGNFKTFRKNHTWRILLADAESRGDFINADFNLTTEKLKKLVFKELGKKELQKKKKEK